MRDGISILERCIQDGDNEITNEKIKELVGIPKFEYIYKITKSLIEKDSEKALETTEEVINEGKDLYNFLWEIIKYIKDILILKSKGKLELYNKEELEKIKELSEKSTKEALFYLIKELAEVENDIKWSTQKTIMFQTEIIKLTVEKTNYGEDIEERINKLEQKIESGDIQVKNQKYTTPSPADSEAQGTSKKVNQSQKHKLQ